MKSIITLLFLSLSSYLFGQEEIKFPRNEIKINAGMLYNRGDADRTIGLAYETIFDRKKTAFGIHFSVFPKTTEYKVHFAPHYRYYTGKGIGSGIFFEGSPFMLIASGVEIGGTIGTGFKWAVQKGGFLFEFFARTGRWFGPYIADASNEYGQLGIMIGVRL